MRFENGWIKVSRKLLSQDWSDCLDVIGKGVLLQVLLYANYRDSRYRSGKEILTLKRGQLMVGLRSFAEQCGIDRGTLVRRLKILCKLDTIDMQTNQFGTIITIKNYDKYQCSENDHEPQTNQERSDTATATTTDTATATTTDTATATTTLIEESKNLKKERKKRNKEVNSIPGGSIDPPMDTIESVNNATPILAKEKTPGAKIWDAYAAAYMRRYGKVPYRNAKENALCAGFAKLLPFDDAVQMIEFYLGHANQFYVSNAHPIWVLSRDYQKLATEMHMGIRISRGDAQRAEVSQTNDAVFQRFMKKEGIL